MAATRGRTALALVVVATALACQSTYYDEYLASHATKSMEPEWRK